MYVRVSLCVWVSVWAVCVCVYVYIQHIARLLSCTLNNHKKYNQI